VDVPELEVTVPNSKLADQWRDFEARALPANVGEVQRIEMRRAFYAGAQALLGTLVNLFDSDREPTENDLKAMDAIKAELDQFAADVKGGVA
jgi:hypothetical protein